MLPEPSQLTETEFYFLRHGETDWNLQHLAQGQTDIPLNARGRGQAHAARDLLSGLGIGTIVSSPLSRALDTAKILQESLGCPLEIVEDLVECGWGAAEGQFRGAWFDDWKAGRFLPKDAETYENFLKRALRGINQALACPGPVLIVAHGGIYWTIQKHATLDAEFDLPNATPVRHDPPRTGFPWWNATLLSAAIPAVSDQKSPADETGGKTMPPPKASFPD